MSASSSPPVGSCSVHSSSVGAWILPTQPGSHAKSLRTSGSCSTSVLRIARSNPGRRVDGAAQVHQLVGDHLLVVEQELHPAAHGGVARVLHRRQRAVPQPGHHLGLVGDVAGGVEHQPPHPVGVVRGRPRRHPAAQRLAGQVRRLDAQRVHRAEQVVGEHVDRVRAVGQVRPAVPDHVVGGHPEVPRRARRCRARRPPGGRRCRAAARGRGPTRPAARGCAPRRRRRGAACGRRRPARPRC